MSCGPKFRTDMPVLPPAAVSLSPDEDGDPATSDPAQERFRTLPGMETSKVEGNPVPTQASLRGVDCRGHLQPTTVNCFQASLVHVSPQTSPRGLPAVQRRQDVPCITLDEGPVFDMLVTEGFQVEVMVPPEEAPRVVIVFDVPTFVSVTCLATPPSLLSLKRRFVGRTARPQLLGSVQGDLPDDVWICGLGRKRVAPFTPPEGFSQRLGCTGSGCGAPHCCGSSFCYFCISSS